MHDATSDPVARLNAALEGRYAIEREVGSGGMAIVYLAQDLKHHRSVAVKVLRPDLAATMGPDRFVREIEVAANLTHPHILPLYDSGEADGFLYYVMPFIDGESLRDRLVRDQELPVNETVKILHEISDALAHAHKHGVVHRDIKPDNVLLSEGHAFVTDFGVSKAVSEATGRERLTTMGVALGTPSYMAPEQAGADPNIDHRADIYAVGVVGYELLAGRPPFTGGSPQMILTAHMTKTPEPLRTHRDSVPRQLEHVIMRCLEKKPADRWQTAEQLVAQLETVITPSGGMTPLDTHPVQSPGRGRRKRWIAGLAAAAILAIAGTFTGLALSGGGGSGAIESIAVLPIEDLSGTDEAFADGLHAALITQLAQLGVVGVVPRSAVMTYRELPKGTREIARELSVDAIIEATVFRDGDFMRITVQMTEPQTLRLLWTEGYVRDVSDVLSAQREMAEKITTDLRSVLTGVEENEGAQENEGAP